MSERRGKYNARKTTVDNVVFASKRESERYKELKLLHAAGKITLLELQPKFELQPAFRHRQSGKMIRSINYIADFEYMDNDYNHIVEDVKGAETEVFRIKRKLFLRQYPHIDFRIVK